MHKLDDTIRVICLQYCVHLVTHSWENLHHYAARKEVGEFIGCSSVMSSLVCCSFTVLLVDDRLFCCLPLQKLEWLCYLMLKTARSYLHSSGQNTGMWWTDRRTDRQYPCGYYSGLHCEQWEVFRFKMICRICDIVMIVLIVYLSRPYIAIMLRDKNRMQCTAGFMLKTL